MGRLGSEAKEILARMGHSEASIRAMEARMEGSRSSMRMIDRGRDSIAERAARARGRPLAVVRADPVAPADPEDQPGDVPEKPVEKKKKKAKRHESLMAGSPAYRHAYEDTRATRDASAPMSTKTKARLEEQAKVSPFSPDGLLGAKPGKPHATRSVRELSEQDAIAVAGGYNGADAVLAARAILPGVSTHAGCSFISTMDPTVATQSQSQADRDLAVAKAKAAVR